MSLTTRTRRIVGSASILVSLGALALSGMTQVAAQDDPGGGTAATTAAVDTKELCIWFVGGIPGSVALRPVDGGTVQYDGTALSLTSGDDPATADVTEGLSDVEIYVSGSDPEELGAGTIDAHRDCTFYGSAEGIAFQAALAAGGFTAASDDEGDDNNMDFTQDTDLPLAYSVEDEGCRSGETGDGNLWAVDGLSATNGSGIVATDIAKLTQANTYPQQSDTDGENSACTVSQVVTVSVPADLTPAYPGTDYTFTGPTLTFSFVIEAAPEA